MVLLLSFIQDHQANGISSGHSWTSLGDPLFLQVGVGLLLLLVLFRVFWVLKRSLHQTRARKRLIEYLEAVESVFSGDAKSAVPKLERVLSDDPENLGARLALARAQLQLQRPAEAHRRNLEAIEVFGAEGAGVELAMIRSLIAAGEESEALERLESVEDRFPGIPAIWELSWELHEECGLYEKAVRAGKKVLAERSREEIRKRLARTTAKAGTLLLQRGEKKKALAFFKESLGLNPEEIQAQRGLLALDPNNGQRILESSLLTLENSGRKPAGSELSKVGKSKQEEGILQQIHIGDLLTDAECPSCHAPRNPERNQCQSCGDDSPSIYAHESYSRVISNPGETLDGIEQNEAWIGLQLEKAQKGEESVLEELEATGSHCLPSLLRFLCSTPQPLQSIFDLCLRLGRKFPEDFLQAIHGLMGDKGGFWDFLRLEAPGKKVIRDLVCNLGTSALPAFREERDSSEALSKPQRRSMILDFFLGLKDPTEFDSLFARFSPFEIIRHLNQSNPSSVADLMVALASSESLSRSLFVEDALECEEALILALERSTDNARKTIMQWIVTKGPRTSLIHRLVEKLDSQDPEPFEAALRAFALDGRKVLVERFADPSLSNRCSDSLQRVLLQAGPGVIADLCRCFGSAPAPSDDRIRSLLVHFGPAAIPEILRAYRQQRGFLSLIGFQQNLARHARSLLLRVLHQIDPQGECFKTIESFEKDPELLSLIRYFHLQDGGDHA